MRLALVLLITPALSGCVWFGFGCATLSPHKDVVPRSPHVSGTVLDEHTHAPVPGARIFFTEHPQLDCRSGAAGAFQIEETYTRYGGYVYGPGGRVDWPNKYERWYPALTVSHTNYIPRHVEWSAHHDDVILLRKLGESPAVRLSLIFDGTGAIVQNMGAADYLKQGGIRILDTHEGEAWRDRNSRRLTIEFARRVYEPHVTALRVHRDSNAAQVVQDVKREGLDWEFWIRDLYPGVNMDLREMKASARLYRLEFIP